MKLSAKSKANYINEKRGKKAPFKNMFFVMRELIDSFCL